MLPYLILGLSAVSAAGTIYGGVAGEKSSELNAYQMETDKKFNQAQAMQAAQARREEYDLATASNIASFAAAGRDIAQDRSVEAFLKRQEEILGKDLSRIQNQTNWEDVKSDMAAMAERRRGRNALTASLFQAAGTVGQGIYNYQIVK